MNANMNTKNNNNANQFLNAIQSHNATTFNGAVAHNTTGSSVLDYFSKAGAFRGRSYSDVVASLASVFGESEELGLKVALYNRMVSRKIQGFNDDLDTVQKGQGQRDEFIKTLKYLEENRKDLLAKNLWLVPLVGRWSDLWSDSVGSKFYHYTDTKLVYELVKIGLSSDKQRPLIAKYLPKIRSASNVKNDRHKRMNAWAKGLCSFLDWTEKDYRTFKSNPENQAHQFQRYMSSGQWDKLASSFNKIPGKALFNIVNSKKDLLKRHNLENSYVDWIKKQPVAKFTGYAYELYNAAKDSSNRGRAKRYTFDAQFNQLIENAKSGVNPELLKKGVFCALDTSGSMSSFEYGTSDKGVKFAPIDVCLGLGIYFSTLIEGTFKDHVIMFDRVSRMVKLTGTFCDKVDQLWNLETAWGNTDFQSVIDEIVRIRKSCPTIPISDYPKILLVVSDMSLDSTGSTTTNYEEAMKKLRAVGLSDMTVIWWDMTGNELSVPNKMDDKGVVMISGWDGSIVSRLLEVEDKEEEKVVQTVKEDGSVVEEKVTVKVKATPYEVMLHTLDQEILRLVKV